MLGCHCWVPCWGAMLGCHCWVPLLGAMLGCHCWAPCWGAIAGVPLLGCHGAMAGCHCWVPLLDASYQLWRSSHCWVPLLWGCHCWVPLREKIDQSVTPFSAGPFSTLITHKLACAIWGLCWYNWIIFLINFLWWVLGLGLLRLLGLISNISEYITSAFLTIGSFHLYMECHHHLTSTCGGLLVAGKCS